MNKKIIFKKPFSGYTADCIDNSEYFANNNVFKNVKPLKVFMKGWHKNKPFSQTNTQIISERLKESEIRYRRLFQTAQDGIIILDFTSGKIIDANPFIINIIDNPIEAILGKKLWEIGLFSNRDESEKAFVDLITNGYIRFEDMPIARKNGNITEVEFISNVYWANKTKVIQCNIRDITERKNAEKNQKNVLRQIGSINEELLKSKIKAEESDNLKSAFLANMSHEIRTPMNAIIGFANFLLQPDLTKDKIENYVQIINTSSQQLLSIISDIIDISKIDTGQINIRIEPVNINKMLNELFITYQKTAVQSDIILKLKNQDTTGYIEVNSDENRIRQILCNLLNNALKFTKEGKIEFGYNIIKDYIEFYVTDTGRGIAPENQLAIFERFSQIKSKDHIIYGGNGLGLAISKSLVEKLGGNININSVLDVGSKFTFTIPYNNKVAQITNVNVSAKKLMPDWQEKTILIVEDEIYNHVYLEEILNFTHVNIEHAWDGKEAIEQVKKHSEISLVLMDIKMPEMDGLEATRQIKLIRPKLPVIAQTAFSLSHDRDDAVAAGCDDYLSKPLDRFVFLDMIGNYL